MLTQLIIIKKLEDHIWGHDLGEACDLTGVSLILTEQHLPLATLIDYYPCTCSHEWGGVLHDQLPVLVQITGWGAIYLQADLTSLLPPTGLAPVAHPNLILGCGIIKSLLTRVTIHLVLLIGASSLWWPFLRLRGRSLWRGCRRFRLLSKRIPILTRQDQTRLMLQFFCCVLLWCLLCLIRWEGLFWGWVFTHTFLLRWYFTFERGTSGRLWGLTLLIRFLRI